MAGNKLGSEFGKALVSPTGMPGAAPTAGPTGGAGAIIDYVVGCEAHNVQGCSKQGCEYPPSRVITVQTDYEVPRRDPLFTDIIEAIRIRYEWGVIQHIARTDLMRGVPVTLCGPRVSVFVEYPRVDYVLPVQQPIPPPARQPPVLIKVSIGLDGTKAESGITSSARFTVPIGDIPAGAESPVFQIPDWAASAVLQTRDVAIVGLELRQFADQEGILRIGSGDIGKGDSDSVPIDGALSFTVNNPGLVDALGVRVIFYLSL